MDNDRYDFLNERIDSLRDRVEVLESREETERQEEVTARSHALEWVVIGLIVIEIIIAILEWKHA